MKIVNAVLGLWNLALARFANPFYMLWTAIVTAGGCLIMYILGSKYSIEREFLVNVGALVCTAIIAIAATYLGPRSEWKRRFVSLFIWIVLVLLVWIGIAATHYAIAITPFMVIKELTSSVGYVISSVLGIIIAELLIYLFAVISLRIRSSRSAKLPPKTET